MGANTHEPPLSHLVTTHSAVEFGKKERQKERKREKENFR